MELEHAIPAGEAVENKIMITIPLSMYVNPLLEKKDLEAELKIVKAEASSESTSHWNQLSDRNQLIDQLKSENAYLKAEIIKLKEKLDE